MVALRSRRLQAIFGVPLDDLQYEHLEALVHNQVSEAFDLDFKGSLYGNADRDRRDLATDVAALANTAGRRRLGNVMCHITPGRPGAHGRHRVPRPDRAS